MNRMLVIVALVAALGVTIDSQEHHPHPDDQHHHVPVPVYVDCINREEQTGQCSKADVGTGTSPNTCNETDHEECLCGGGYQQVRKIHCVPDSYTDCSSDEDCSGNGDCYTDGNGTNKCYCEASHTGDACATSINTTTCENDQMTVTIDPRDIGEPNAVFISHAPSHEKCNLTKDGDGVWTKTISLREGVEPCVAHKREHHHDPDEDVYQVRVHLTYTRAAGTEPEGGHHPGGHHTGGHHAAKRQAGMPGQHHERVPQLIVMGECTVPKVEE